MRRTAKRRSTRRAEKAERDAAAKAAKAEEASQRKAAKAEKRAARRENPSRIIVMFRRLRDRQTAQVVVLSVIAIALYPILVPVHAQLYGTYLPVAMFLGAAAVTAPLISRHRPRTAVALFLVAAVLLPWMAILPEAAIAVPWPWSVPMIIAFVVFLMAITLQHGWRYGLFVLVAGIALVMLPAGVIPDISASGGLIADLIVTASVASAAYLIAVLVAGQLRITDELVRERAQSAQELARRELIEERTRIARELHDVVAHSMSLIQVQASTARYRLPDIPDDAASEFDAIAATARTSLGEMRRILGVLRTEDHTAELAPQRGIDQLAALVETTRRAGADVSLSGRVKGDVDASAQIALYRITQEALSNAVRHAPGAAISVALSSTEEHISAWIANGTSTEPVAHTWGGGHGVRGMTERAELLGGSVQAGPDAAGGWVVSARLPRHPASGAAEKGTA
ncbi:sensor histidine kinase [Microbacterium sp. NPDC057659]|uniref:sensor histidine kinase n=1 Tax=Microbacterium sp. NPDC057659 TaxID=3346198 RepID=UPI00366F6DB9